MASGDGDGGRADYYDILGVPDTATADDIIRAYRRLAREHHPDHNPAGGSKRFQEITDAYDVIGDAHRRAAYDAERRGGSHRGVRIPVNRGPVPGGAATAGGPTAERPVVRLSFREAVLGTVASVEITDDQACGGCGGSGRSQPRTSCPDCGGSGSVTRQTGQIPVRHICATCRGRGRPAPQACAVCGASGRVAVTRPVKVRVPAGVHDGARLRVRRPEPHRPLEAVVRVDPDPRFAREGDHLTVRVPVTPAEAALGADVEVPTVDGSTVAVRIPPGIQPGRRLRVAGRGVRRAPDRTGDLLVTVDVVVPAVLSDAERAAYEALRAVSANPRATN